MPTGIFQCLDCAVIIAQRIDINDEAFTTGYLDDGATIILFKLLLPDHDGLNSGLINAPTSGIVEV
jgi:hypothetical protein